MPCSSSDAYNHNTGSRAHSPCTPTRAVPTRRMIWTLFALKIHAAHCVAVDDVRPNAYGLRFSFYQSQNWNIMNKRTNIPKIIPVVTVAGAEKGIQPLVRVRLWWHCFSIHRGSRNNKLALFGFYELLNTNKIMVCSNGDFQTFRSFLRACLRSFFFCFSDRFSLLRSMRLKLSLSVACVMCFTAPRFEPISARDAWSPCGVCFQVSPGSSNKPTGCQNNV